MELVGYPVLQGKHVSENAKCVNNNAAVDWPLDCFICSAFALLRSVHGVCLTWNNMIGGEGVVMAKAELQLLTIFYFSFLFYVSKYTKNILLGL